MKNCNAVQTVPGRKKGYEAVCFYYLLLFTLTAGTLEAKMTFKLEMMFTHSFTHFTHSTDT